MREVRRIGRRTWLTRMAGGALAVWTGLNFGLGREGWGVKIGMTPRQALAGMRGLAATQTFAPTEALRVILGQGGFVSAYVLVRGGEAALVDTGVPGSAQAIGETIQNAGLGWDAVRDVILTHHHFDHAGSIGDAVANIGGDLQRSPERFTADVAQANESVRKMAGIYFERALFMHGDPIDSGASARFAELAARL